jgi:hypothetical protein
MKKSKKARAIMEVNSEQWRIQQQLEKFMRSLDYLKDAAEVKKDKQNVAPLTLHDLIF